MFAIIEVKTLHTASEISSEDLVRIFFGKSISQVTKDMQTDTNHPLLLQTVSNGFGERANKLPCAESSHLEDFPLLRQPRLQHKSTNEKDPQR
jgi:hypothetical protein